MSKTVHLLMPVSISDEWADGPDVAYVELDAGQARYLLEWMNRVEVIKQSEDQAICDIRLWDNSPLWFRLYHIEDWYETQGKDMEEWVESIEGGEGAFFLSERPGWADDMRADLIDCVTAHIGPAEMYWNGYLKNTSVTVEAHYLNREELEEVLEQCLA